MRHFRLVALCLSGSLCLASPVIAKDEKISVSVSISGNDLIGKRLSFAVREAIRVSGGYRLGGPTDASLFEISLVTMDPGNGDLAGLQTIVSVAYTMTNLFPLEQGNPQTWYPVFLTHSVMSIGTNRVEEMAKSILANLDSAIEQYKLDIKKKVSVPNASLRLSPSAECCDRRPFRLTLGLSATIVSGRGPASPGGQELLLAALIPRRSAT